MKNTHDMYIANLSILKAPLVFYMTTPFHTTETVGLRVGSHGVARADFHESFLNIKAHTSTTHH